MMKTLAILLILSLCLALIADVLCAEDEGHEHHLVKRGWFQKIVNRGRKVVDRVKGVAKRVKGVVKKGKKVVGKVKSGVKKVRDGVKKGAKKVKKFLKKIFGRRKRYTMGMNERHIKMIAKMQ